MWNEVEFCLGMTAKHSRYASEAALEQAFAKWMSKVVISSIESDTGLALPQCGVE